jgi:hypothetical protein
MRILTCFALLIVLVVVSACSDSAKKIGASVKGERVNVMEQTKSIKADPDLQHERVQLPELVNNRNWSQVGYDTSHVMPHANVKAAPEEDWSRSIGEGSDSDYRILSRPVVDNGVVFTMDSHGLVTASSVRDGAELWTFDTTPTDNEAHAIAGGLGVDGSTVYATTGFGQVLAINTKDGVLRWRKSLQNPLRAAPTIADDRVYVVTINNELFALQAKDGTELWHHNGIIESATLMGASCPAVVGDSVVVAYSSGEIFNLRSENGRVSWSDILASSSQKGAMPAIADIRGLPVVDHGHVFAISHSGRMASIDQRTGDRDWEIDVGGTNTPLLADDVVFVLSTDNELVAIMRDSGRVMWVQQLPLVVDPEDKKSDPIQWAGPVLGNGQLWMTNSAGHLASFSAEDGHPMAEIDLGEPTFIPPVIADNTIFVVRDDGHLLALR